MLALTCARFRVSRASTYNRRLRRVARRAHVCVLMGSGVHRRRSRDGRGDCSEILLGFCSVRVTDDRAYRCDLKTVANAAVQVAQLAIGWHFVVLCASCSKRTLSLSPWAGCLGLRGVDRRRGMDQSRWSPSVVLRWQLAVWVGGWVGAVG